MTIHGRQERWAMGRRIGSDGRWLDSSPIVIDQHTYRPPYAQGVTP